MMQRTMCNVQMCEVQRATCSVSYRNVYTLIHVWIVEECYIKMSSDSKANQPISKLLFNKLHAKYNTVYASVKRFYRHF